MSKMKYNDVAKDVDEQRLGQDAAHLHGLLTAWMCVTQNKSDDWLTALLPNAKMTPTLQALYDTTKLELKSDDFAFHLLLPDEADAIEKRAQALAVWCQGFLEGLAYVQTDCLKGRELEEAIRDISQIAELDYESLQDDNDSEEALTELEEFVRIAVLFIETELRPKNTGVVHH
jgi:uncharacterized protein